MYDIKLIDIAVRCVFTNTTTTAPYRGAGRPEANYILERVIDEAARVTGIDPIKLRRRNLIKSSAMPYKTAVGTTIDSGEFETVLDKALALADYDGFKQRRREAAKRGKYRGLGISCMLEHAGGFPLEGTALSFPGGETPACSTLNVQSTGQGHATVFNPHAGGAARHQAGADRAPARRFRDGDRGLCVGRLALRDDREPCA